MGKEIPQDPQPGGAQHPPEGGHPSAAQIGEQLREDDAARLPPTREQVDKRSPVNPRTGEEHQH